MNEIISRLKDLGLHTQARVLTSGVDPDRLAFEANDLILDAMQDRRKLRVSKKAGVRELTRLIERLVEVADFA